MDNARPSLDLKHFDDVCLDKNGTCTCKHKRREKGVDMRNIFLVPVIAVFTKYDQLRRDVLIELDPEDQGLYNSSDQTVLDDKLERIFTERYLQSLKASAPIVRLEGECFVN